MPPLSFPIVCESTATGFWHLSNRRLAHSAAKSGWWTIASGGESMMTPAMTFSSWGTAVRDDTSAPPDDCPIAIIRCGSPPNASALSRTQVRAVIPSESCVLVSKRSAGTSDCDVP